MLSIKLFTLPLNESTHEFDDSDCRDFIKDKNVKKIKQQFFIHQELPHLLLSVTYDPSHETSPVKSAKKSDDSWREILKDEQLPLYHHMREWRNEVARQAGLQPYVICNNKQLATIVNEQPTNVTQLIKIEGFGQAKAFSQL